MRLGAMLPNLPVDPVELARAHRAQGFRAVVCPPNVSLNDLDYLRAVREAFAAEDLLIAEVGAWRNVISLDPERRRKGLEFVCERLAVADEIGARCCVDYIGTLDPASEYGPHPDNLDQPGFDITVETIRQILDTVKPRRTRFCLEMMQWVLPDNPSVYKLIIEAVDHPMFAAHLDPTNLVVSPRIYYHTGELIRECFRVLGPWVVSCHAKDIILRDKLALHLDETPPGTGNLDYRAYLREIERLGPDTPLIIEHLPTTEAYLAARDFIQKTALEL